MIQEQSVSDGSVSMAVARGADHIFDIGRSKE